MASSVKDSKYYYIIVAIYASLIITGVSVTGRLTSFEIPLSHYLIYINGGTFMVPFIFATQDIVTEVYGYARSRRMVQVSIITVTIFIIYTHFVTYLNVPSTYQKVDSAFSTTIHTYFRHYLSFLVGYFVGSFVNDYLLAKLKIITAGRYFGRRAIASTLVGELMFQFLGLTVAWIGTLHFSSQIIPLALFSYGYNLFIELAALPIIILIVKYLKRIEGIDQFDEFTNFNPFVFNLDDTR